MSLIFKPPNFGRIVPASAKVKIDWSHPITNGLINAYLPGNSLIDLVRNVNILTGTAASGFDCTPEGPGFKTNNSTTANGLYSQNVPTSSDPLFLPSSSAMLSMYGRWQVNAALNAFNQAFFMVNPDNNNTSPFVLAGFGLPTATTAEIFWNSGGTFHNGTPFTVPQASSPFGTFSLAGTWQVGGNAISFLNGVQQGSNSFGASVPTVNSTAQLEFTGNFGNLTTNPVTTLVAFFWNRLLTSDEIAYLDANPYCFLIADEGEWPMLFLQSFVPGGAPRFQLYDNPDFILRQRYR